MVRLIHNREVLWFLISPKKAKVEEYIRSLKGLNSYFVYLAFFFSNMIEYYVPAKQSDGSLLFTTPIPADLPTPFVDPTSSHLGNFMQYLQTSD
jgi:hypothetical protein